jgi:hypothetical protein
VDLRPQRAGCRERRFNDIELAREASAGMSAILIKCIRTPPWAGVAGFAVDPRIRVFGGSSSMRTVGGLSPPRLAVKMGAKQVWMPTRSARNHRRYEGSAASHPGRTDTSCLY